MSAIILDGKATAAAIIHCFVNIPGIPMWALEAAVRRASKARCIESLAGDARTTRGWARRKRSTAIDQAVQTRHPTQAAAANPCARASAVRGVRTRRASGAACGRSGG